MKDIELIKALVGEGVTEDDLKFTDCYVRPQMGLFIPAAYSCGYAARENHTHPSYMTVVYFEERADRRSHYKAQIFSPDIPHSDSPGRHYYCILTERGFFESRYKMYSDSLPVFSGLDFELCSDILKAMNMFAFEYSKEMANSDVTLNAQAEIITHWIIRSLMGENMDMRAVSDDYSVARAQHYMERHYGERITVAGLSGLGYVSPSCFSRKFRNETGVSPIEYLIEIRIQRAKLLLRRKSLPITDIALECGFGSSAYFSACFQERTGISPTEYRDRYAEN